MTNLKDLRSLAEKATVTEETFGRWVDQAQAENEQEHNRWSFRYHQHGKSAIKRMKGQRQTIIALLDVVERYEEALETIEVRSLPRGRGGAVVFTLRTANEICKQALAYAREKLGGGK